MWSKFKKEKAKGFLEEKSIPCNPAMLAVELKQLVREHIVATEMLENIQQAKAQGCPVYASLL